MHRNLLDSSLGGAADRAEARARLASRLKNSMELAAVTGRADDGRKNEQRQAPLNRVGEPPAAISSAKNPSDP
jgi:hypothetical protein